MSEIKILAHRTGMGQYPPNSLAGLKGCFADGAFGFECDLTFLSSEEEPFVWLKSMKRILKSPLVKLEQMSPSEIVGLGRIDCDEKILPLGVVFDFLEQYPLRAYFDVKYYGMDVFGQLRPISSHLLDLTARKVIRPALRRGLANRIEFVTFGGGSDLLQLAKEVNGCIGTNLIIALPWLTVDQHLDYLDSITIGWKRPNPWNWPWCAGRLERLLEAARSSGLKVYGGLADTKEEVRWLKEKSFDGIWTNQVSLVRDVLNNQKEDR